MGFLIDTATAATLMGVSSRRVRALLAVGRMRGCKDHSGHWQAVYPFSVSPGARGPYCRAVVLKQRPKGSGMPERSGGMETAEALPDASTLGRSA